MDGSAERVGRWIDRAVEEAKREVQHYTTMDENVEGIEILAVVLRRSPLEPAIGMPESVDWREHIKRVRADHRMGRR